MKILLTSDIHGNHEALKTLLTASPPFDVLVCLGDITGYYPQVNEVAALLRSHPLIALRGNHDEMTLHGDIAGLAEPVRFGIETARAELLPEHREWLAELPARREVELGGRRFLFVHGSPWDPLNEYIHADSPKLPEIAALPFDVVAWGHTHREVFSQQSDGRWLINPGSVGQSRSSRGHACAALFCTETMAALPLAISYNPATIIAACQARGAGEWVAKSLTKD